MRASRRLLRTATLLLALQLAFYPHALAQPMSDISLSPWFYLSGGVGAESRAAMREQRDFYTLRLTFARAGTGTYLAGVSVSIEPMAGGEVLGPYGDCGPLFYVRLLPGTYRISASYQGSVQTRLIRLGEQPLDQVVYWPAS